MNIKNPAIAVFTAISFLGCANFNSDRNPASVDTYYVSPKYSQFRTAAADAITFRSQALNFAQEKNLDKSSTAKLSRSEGEWVRMMGRNYLQTRNVLLGLSVDQGKHFADANTFKLVPYQGTTIKERTNAVPRADDDPKPRFEFKIDPTDSKGKEFIFNVQMALASSLILMDNYLVAIKPYRDNSSMNYVLNYDSEQKQALEAIANSYANPTNRNQIAKAIKFIDEVMAWRRANSISTSNEEVDLYTVTQSSLWYLTLKNATITGSIADSMSALWDTLTMRGKRGTRIISYGLSKGFGNMVGLVETRKGLLNDMPKSERQQIISEMQPLDILMEKTPFRLTDKMIPGHYGHVAIWIGTEQQLKDLNVWNDIPAKIQAKIRAGHSIVEALRPGVELNTLEHFLNIDDFLVLRDARSNVSDKYKREAILKAIAQIGKEYDFNFDVNTHERIVCSEIAYVVFGDIKWPLENTLNRYTISPDNVAQLAVGNERIFQPVIMYYNGVRYKKDLTHSLSLLLKADDKSYEEFQRFQSL